MLPDPSSNQHSLAELQQQSASDSALDLPIRSL